MDEVRDLLNRKEREIAELRKTLGRLEAEADTLRRTLVILQSDKAKSSGLREYDSFSKFFEDFCREQHSNIKDMCEAIGFSEQAYYKWLRGARCSDKMRSLIANGISQLSRNKYPADYVYRLLDRMRRSTMVDIKELGNMKKEENND